jgi:hypothetical protein
MSDKVTLDRIDFQKIKDHAAAERAEYMRRYVTVAFEVAGSPLRRHPVIAIAAMLIISFGVKMFLMSAPTAEADTPAVPSARMNVLQMHRDIDTKSIPVQKMNDNTFIFTDED